jgi:hypothetical protein
MHSCNVEFDILKSGYQWWPIALLPALALLSSLTSYFTGYRSKLMVVVAPSTMAAFGLVLYLISTLVPYLAARSDYMTGMFKQVSGAIEDYRSTPTLESFSVSGVMFTHQRVFFVPGFDGATASGSPLRDGLSVGIRYVDDIDYFGRTILWLEVCWPPETEVRPFAAAWTFLGGPLLALSARGGGS